MDVFEKKYGIRTDEKIEAFHRSRRMFCIKERQLVMAESNLPYSHAVWFKKEGWADETDDSFMNNITRGMVDKQGDIYFYKGYDFSVDEKAERELFSCMGELKKVLNLKPTAKVCGGKNWSSSKFYGILEDVLKFGEGVGE